MRSINGEKVTEEECIYVLPDGSSLNLRVSSAPVHDSEGKIIAAAAVGRDTGEQDREDDGFA